MTVRVAVQKDGVTAEDLRFALQAFMAPAGASNARSGVIPGAGTPADLVSVSALQAKVVAFQAWVDGTSNATQAGYLFTADADVTLTFGAGNGTNPRIDLVVARIRDDPYDASGSQTGTVEIVAGTPAGSPVAPAVPASSLPLWQVLVPANASGGNPIVFSSARTDRRVYTGPLGAPFAVASAAERNAVASPYAGMAVWRADSKLVERYDGASWRTEGVAAVAGFANLATTISDPYDGQLAYTNTEDTLWRYDSGTATWVLAAGLGAWSTWTPAWTSTGTAPAIGNGILTGTYQRIGKLVVVRGFWQAGSTTTMGTGTYRMSTPVTLDSAPNAQVPHPMAWFRRAGAALDYTYFALVGAGGGFTEFRATGSGGNAQWAAAVPAAPVNGDWFGWEYTAQAV